jgi:hypothetical protein
MALIRTLTVINESSNGLNLHAATSRLCGRRWRGEGRADLQSITADAACVAATASPMRG